MPSPEFSSHLVPTQLCRQCPQRAQLCSGLRASETHQRPHLPLRTAVRWFAVTLNPKRQASTKGRVDRLPASCMRCPGPMSSKGLPHGCSPQWQRFLQPLPSPPILQERGSAPPPVNTPPGTSKKKNRLITVLSCLHSPPGVRAKPKLPVLAHSPVHRRVVLQPCWES